MRKHALNWMLCVLATGCTEGTAPSASQPGRGGVGGSGGDAGAACEFPRPQKFAWSYRAGRYPLPGDEPDGNAGATGANGGAGGGDGAGAPGAAGEASEAGAAGQVGMAVCSGEVSFTVGFKNQYVDCAAMARVEAFDGGVRLVFDDDTILETTDGLASIALDPYEVVWVEYHLDESLDGRNGHIADEIRLTIRDAPGRRLLVFGYGGVIPQSTPATVETEIFGASLLAEPHCTVDLSTPCFGELRTVQDFIVQSLPPVRLPHGTLTTVEHDDERFAVRISNSVVLVSPGTSVCQGRRPTDSTAFMAIRQND